MNPTKYTALFEIDLKKREVLFTRVGLLKDYIKPKIVYSYDESFKSFLEKGVHPEDRKTLLDVMSFNNLSFFKSEGKPSLRQEFRCLPSDSTEFQWFAMTIMFHYGDNQALGTIENINEEKLSEIQIQYQAAHDPLTGLLNRAAFHSAVTDYMGKKDAAGMYAFLDIDNFKYINDTKGHLYGDMVLVSIADAIRASAPPHSILGRFGGDEFNIFIPEVVNESEAGKLAGELVNKIASLDLEISNISTSIGISFFPRDGVSLDGGVSAHADIAMYKVKETGKNGYRIYDSSMGDTISYHRTEEKRAKKSSHISLYIWLKNNPKLIFSSLGLFLFMLLTLIILTSIYVKKLHKIVDEESYGYLEEISSQINTNLRNGLHLNYATLETLANKLTQNQTWSLARAEADLKREADIYHFKYIGLINKKGNWQYGGKSFSHSNLFSAVTTMNHTKEPVASQIVSLNQTDCIAFLYPLPNIKIEGTTYIGLGAITPVSGLNEILSPTLFNMHGYAHVITSSGDMVIRSPYDESTLSGSNVLSHLQNVDLYDGLSLEEIEKDFQLGKSGKIRYRDQGNEILSVYSPVGYEDWYLYTVIPTSALNSRTQGFYILTVLICTVISVIFLFMLIVIFLTQIRSRWKLVHLLHTDPLTLGSSMVKFEQDVNYMLRQKEHSYSIIYANVKKFKSINEQLGKQAADELLKQIYHIIQDDLETHEFVCRLMADHFGILIAEQNNTSIRQRINSWNLAMQDYVLNNNFPCLVLLSYGVYQINCPETEVALLLDRANLARKALEHSGSVGQIGFYDKLLEQKIRFEEDLEQRQEKALASGEFYMYLQPKYNPYTGAIAGAEALVRWIPKRNSMIYPDQFIPLFENNGFIVKLDQFIFEEACRFISKMKYMGFPPIPISVNLSRVNLNHPGFIWEFIRILNHYQVAPELIEFEITENLIYDNLEHLNQVIAELHNYGFLVSMDDFGSGYSSLNMLKNIDLDVIKLDRNFFLQAGKNSDKANTIVHYIIALSKKLGLIVVAEGVESEEQVNFLKKQKCDLIQGYYYSKPIPPEDVLQLLAMQAT